MSRFSEAVEQFISTRRSDTFSIPLCYHMEPKVKGVLQDLQKNPTHGEFYTTSSLVWDSGKEHIEEIVTAANDVDLKNVIIFIKNPRRKDPKISLGLRNRIGETNITALLADTDGQQFLFAVHAGLSGNTSMGFIRRPIVDKEILPLFTKRLGEFQKRRRGQPLPTWPPAGF